MNTKKRKMLMIKEPRSILERSTVLVVATIILSASLAGFRGGGANTYGSSTVPLLERTQLQVKDGSWHSSERTERIDPKKCAIIICDMWDNHWCRGSAARVNTLATRMVPVLQVARQHGVLIIHAPSETMDFYKDAPQRKRAEEAVGGNPPPARELVEPPLPIDFADGGCETSPPDKFYKAWSRENAIIPIMSEDLISTDGTEIYRALKARNINTVMYVGVHANICILRRPFAIRQMRAWGLHCMLIRDLTDAMYNPRDRPYVSHQQGTELVIEHIERYLAPSILSADF